MSPLAPEKAWSRWVSRLRSCAGLLFFFSFAFFSLRGQSIDSTPGSDPRETSPPPSAPEVPAAPTAVPPATQRAVDRLTQANQELLDLLKRQQAVLEDIQYDRRLQSRQISSLEERLTDSIQENAQLQAKVAHLEEQISIGPSTGTTGPTPASPPADASATPTGTIVTSPPSPPPAPASYLPPATMESTPGVKSWHRLFTLSGTEGKNSDPFQIEGRRWRVVWHNQDRPGDAYANTSALFINAFAQDDTIPQQVCSKLGSGGDATQLKGSGRYSLKIEASGGSWELAVEDFK